MCLPFKRKSIPQIYMFSICKEMFHILLRVGLFLKLDFFYIVFTSSIKNNKTGFDSDNDYLSVKKSTLIYFRQKLM